MSPKTILKVDLSYLPQSLCRDFFVYRFYKTRTLLSALSLARLDEEAMRPRAAGLLSSEPRAASEKVKQERSYSSGKSHWRLDREMKRRLILLKTVFTR